MTKECQSETTLGDGTTRGCSKGTIAQGRDGHYGVYNLDEYSTFDNKLQEILDLARAEDLPVIIELNKRTLGKSLGKSMKVSVVCIQNADGAHQQFKLLKKMKGCA